MQNPEIMKQFTINQRCWQSWQVCGLKKKRPKYQKHPSCIKQQKTKKSPGNFMTSNCFLMDSPSSKTAIEDSDPRREGNSPPTSSFSFGFWIKQKTFFCEGCWCCWHFLCESVWILLLQVTKDQKKISKNHVVVMKVLCPRGILTYFVDPLPGGRANQLW